MPLRFGRRDFIKGLGWGLAGLGLPLEAAAQRFAGLGPAPVFFSDHERATLTALCDRILPPDADPGAGALGAARYIEVLLTAFDVADPHLFARGPFSDRNPFPDLRRGVPSDRLPQNFFLASARPSRLQELYWRAEILGSAAAGIPAPLDAQQGGPRVGLRDLYRAALAKVDQVAVDVSGHPFVELMPSEQDRVFRRIDSASVFPPDPSRGGRSFVDLLIGHTLEGCFAAPEYGGNANTDGWRMIRIEGDVQPLGYSLFSTETGSYHERPDHPMSTANPDELDADGSVVPRPLSPDGASLQSSITFSSFFAEVADPGSKP
jgi:Gluconate 2-dehydrogenase subunit 3